MSEIKKILVALAFGEYSKDVFNYAAKLALDLGASLTAVHIIDIKYVEALSQVEAMGYEASAEKYIESSKEERHAQFDELAKEASFPPEKMKKIIEVGHPDDQLIKVIAREKVELVVMGARSHSKMPHVLVGSVANKVFHHSPVPVLFYRFS
jgi:nucleotide-binding universal stress UspA family protein